MHGVARPQQIARCPLHSPLRKFSCSPLGFGPRENADSWRGRVTYKRGESLHISAARLLQMAKCFCSVFPV